MHRFRNAATKTGKRALVQSTSALFSCRAKSQSQRATISRRNQTGLCRCSTDRRRLRPAGSGMGTSNSSVGDSRKCDGITEHVGVYEAFIPTDMAECLWAEPISSTSVFDASVFDTAGQAKPATTSVTVTSAGIEIKASGFTYSSPTIRVSKSSSAPQVGSSPTGTSAKVGSTLASPTGVKASGAKQTASISFTRQQGFRYSVSATKGTSKKTFACSLGKTRVTCKASRLAAGKWKVTVLATLGAKQSAPYVTSVVVK